MIEIIHEPIEPRVPALLQQVSSPLAGAVLLFLGVTRGETGSQTTKSLDYECYQAMAERKLRELESDACQKWPLVSCALVHRVGHLLPQEASVAVIVSSPHRDAAFEAGRWLIDTLKQVVPIWKQENWTDGTSEWVHPGISSDSEQPPTDMTAPAPHKENQ